MPSPRLKVSEYVDGVLTGKRGILSRCITLLESTKDSDRELSRQVIRRVLPYTGKGIRIGITGTPGVGKSTLLDSLGMHIIDQGLSVAVLAIDPSSSRTKGSILGDKTRMQHLSQHSEAFVRPSPSKGFLGGVGQRTKETILLCEAAGFDVVIVETVGVGQSEILISQMTDVFVSLLLPGGGDELQGIKKGLLEMSDIIVINKADGDNLQRAQNTLREHRIAQKYIHSKTTFWKTKIQLCSALTGMGIIELWDTITEYRNTLGSNVQKIRKQQDIHWIWSHVQESIFLDIQKILQKDWLRLQEELAQEQISPFDVQEKLIEVYQNMIDRD
jgi:LAO/AO transport system kinase